MIVDLIAVAFASALTLVLALHYGGGDLAAVFRIPLGFLFVFFLPGYAVTAALFPGSGSSPPSKQTSMGPISTFERLVVSVGLSITGTPLVAVGLTLVSHPVDQVSLLSSLTVLTASCTVIAAVRRYRLDPPYRFVVWLPNPDRVRTRITDAPPVQRLFVGVLILTVAGAGVVVFDTENRETYTEFGLVPDAEGSGNLTAGAYPTVGNTTEATNTSLYVANEEGQAMEYTVVVTLAEFGDEPEEPVRRAELDRFVLSLADGEQTILEHEFEPGTSGDRLRVSYLLFHGEPPAEPTRENAYRSVHLSITVAEE